MTDQTTTNTTASKSGRNLRRYLMDAHRWVGRAAAMFLMLLFLTGTLTVFGHELQALFSPQMWGRSTATPASFGTYLDMARQSYPDARPLIVSRPTAPWMAASVEMAGPGKRIAVWLDPATGEVQGHTPMPGLKDNLRNFHASLLVSGRLPLAAVTSLSLVVLWQIFSGLVSWRRFWRGFLRAPVSGPNARMKWASWHRWAGLWSLPVVLIAGLTGLLYFSETLGFNPPLPQSQKAAERADALPSDFDGAALNRAVATAQARLPGLEIAEIYLPKRAREGVRLRGDLTASLVRPRANTVTVDVDGTTVLGAHTGEDLPFKRRLTEAADPLHFGVWGGQITRVIWVVGGLLAVSLALSGLQILGARNAGQSFGTRLIAAWRNIWLPFRILTLAAVAAGLASLALTLA